MKKYVVIFLLLAPSFFAELLFPNTAVISYFAPAQFILFTLVYGVPALLVYDTWIRYKLSWGGLFLLSLFYAFYIEGIMMKTFLLGYTPEPSFASYGIVFGIAVPWAVSMMISHGVIAMFFPNLLARYYLGDTTSEYFLKNWVRNILLVVVVTLGVLTYFFATPEHPAATYFFIFAAALILAVLAAKHFFKERVASFPLRQATSHVVLTASFGALSFLIFFFVARLLGQYVVHPVLGIAAMILVVAICISVIKVRGWLRSANIVACGLGLYIGSALLGIFIMLPQGRFDYVAISSAVMIGLIYLLVRIQKQRFL